jgi:hypothetical protein
MRADFDGQLRVAGEQALVQDAGLEARRQIGRSAAGSASGASARRASMALMKAAWCRYSVSMPTSSLSMVLRSTWARIASCCAASPPA